MRVTDALRELHSILVFRGDINIVVSDVATLREAEIIVLVRGETAQVGFVAKPNAAEMAEGMRMIGLAADDIKENQNEPTPS